ncbi:unnamed protein product [Miscanthus lutarioriparius]|uniref:Uncharacterized protein n=1 Tax=Miscanthus lutarioriparius TaxID=422564 RepID=A0A811MIF6_9POAL|nr:unnamed protein product [Miscanthus lutarioriparius]
MRNEERIAPDLVAPPQQRVSPPALRKRETTPNVSKTSSAPAVHQADLRPEDPTRAVGHVAAKGVACNDEAAAIGGCGFVLGVDTGEETALRSCNARRRWARRNVGGGGAGVDAAAVAR